MIITCVNNIMIVVLTDWFVCYPPRYFDSLCADELHLTFSSCLLVPDSF